MTTNAVLIPTIDTVFNGEIEIVVASCLSCGYFDWINVTGLCDHCQG
jgi:hypothetical protein